MKELIISYYDSGVYWSISSGNTIYRRDDLSAFGKPLKNKKALLLCNYINSSFRLNDINPFLILLDNVFKECTRVVVCNNGDTFIYNKVNGKWPLK